MKPPDQRPHYSEKMIIGLIRETKTIEDLTDLCNLLRDIEEQKDLTITFRISREVQIQQKTIIYGGDILGDKTT
ncbi:MAG: hypothetical protein J6O88_05975 [Chryseobacterium sp.]|uniref:hypothetical protein n=1 Tax=Chryseobacterium sp. TaxID=1871047 RepID=UPI001B229F59|nr:hypothetical protein [Chryseobacterium sp.]MBO6184231.1 hypothetical protein [Chryseobacterium sp.]